MLLRVPDYEREVANPVGVFLVGFAQFFAAEVGPFGEFLHKVVADFFPFGKSFGKTLFHLLFGKVP